MRMVSPHRDEAVPSFALLADSGIPSSELIDEEIVLFIRQNSSCHLVPVSNAELQQFSPRLLSSTNNIQSYGCDDSNTITVSLLVDTTDKVNIPDQYVKFPCQDCQACCVGAEKLPCGLSWAKS